MVATVNAISASTVGFFMKPRPPEGGTRTWDGGPLGGDRGY